MKRLAKNTLSLSLFMALILVLSANAFTPTVLYGQDYPTAPTSAGYLSNLEDKLSEYPGANIDWYLSDPDANEFYIGTPAELWGLAYLVNKEIEDPPLSGWVWTVDFEGKTINLTSDIDLSSPNNGYTTRNNTYGEAWVSIGWGLYVRLPEMLPGAPGDAPFKGTFDGNGYTISGLADRSLFGMIRNATIKNLSTSGTVGKREQIGGFRIAGVVNSAVDSTLSNLSSDVNLVYNADTMLPVGGIVAEALGNTTVTGCV